MRKRLSMLMLVAALGVGTTAPVAYGETTRVAQEEADDDDGTDYGWIGLLGLAGLAGLLGRKRRDDDDRVRTTGGGTGSSTNP